LKRQRKPSAPKYSARPGGPISAKDVPHVVGFLDDCRRHRVRRRPEYLVKVARSAAHPLHYRFTWDNSAAAELWRINEARQIISAVQIYVARLKVPAKAYHAVNVGIQRAGKSREYSAREEVIVSRPAQDQLSREYYAQIVAMAGAAEGADLTIYDQAWRQLVAAIRTIVPRAARERD